MAQPTPVKLLQRRKIMPIIDLRSDTMTQPTAAMRKAMAEAEVGDDVFGEDPTVNRLEQMAAARLGKEAALLVCSGTMGNLVSQLAHCGRGDEIILGSHAHTFFFEQGGSAAVGGIHLRTVPNQPDGKLALEDIEAAVRGDNVHFPRSRLIILENTHNLCNGWPLDLEYLQAVSGIAQHPKLKVHIDGARFFNAAVALETDPKDLAAPADSVSFCLSKGLAAPVGSMVCGSESFINEARRARKLLGGGMRQAGILAAAGIVALNEMVARLAEDHANAKKLAVGLAQLPGISIDPNQIRTNILFFELTRKDLTPEQFVQRIGADGVRMLAVGPQKIRAVTHYHITAKDIDRALGVISKVMS
jgi:threonine aldolase